MSYKTLFGGLGQNSSNSGFLGEHYKAMGGLAGVDCGSKLNRYKLGP
jgi:hypothetical protein